ILLVLLFFSCSTEKSEEGIKHKSEEKRNFYSILLEENVDSLELLKKWRPRFYRDGNSKLTLIEDLETSGFKLFYGMYKNPLNAWTRGFEFYTEGLISEINLFENYNHHKEYYSDFLFVTNYQNRPAVYSYNLISKNIKMIFDRWGKKVLNLYSGPDFQNYIFTTALTFGRSGGFPYIKDGRVYHYSKVTRQIKELEKFGDGLRISSQWNHPDTFHVTFKMMDTVNSSNIIEKDLSFNRKGNLIDSLVSVHNLLRDGFPVDYVSTLESELFSKLKLTISSLDDSLLLGFNVKGISHTIFVPGKMINIRLSNDDENLVFKTKFDEFISQDSTKSTYRIYNYSLPERKLTNVYSGKQNLSYLLYGGLLFYESINEEKQIINCILMKSDKKLFEISGPGDCGIKSIPLVYKN
ncbi:MAG: hypothetical protein K8F36_00285, partial [Melioribacteraceae bacterium]|nr:hypothetical protein [Melioribacteraceae bacterium]